MIIHILRMLGLAANPSRRIDSPPPALVNPDLDVEQYALECALDLEKRLYESAQSSLTTVFGKESIVASFLSSGSLVAVAAASQAFAQVADRVSSRGALAGLILLTGAVFFLVVGLVLMFGLLRNKPAQDLPGAQKFLDLVLDVELKVRPTRMDVLKQLVSEYQGARERLDQLVARSVRRLFVPLGLLGLSVVLALVAVFVALANVTLGH